MDEDSFSGLFMPPKRFDNYSCFLRVYEVSFTNEDRAAFSVMVNLFDLIEGLMYVG